MKSKTIEEYVQEDVVDGGRVLIVRLYTSAGDAVKGPYTWDHPDQMFGSAIHKEIAGDLVSVSIRNLGQSLAWSEPILTSRLAAIGQFPEAAVLLSRDDFRAVEFDAGEEQTRIRLVDKEEDGGGGS